METVNPTNDYLNYIVGRLEPIGNIKFRPRMGGHSFSLKGVVFGMVMYDRLFLRRGLKNKHNYPNDASDPLMFPGKHQPLTLNYWSVPKHIIEDDELLRRFVMDAYKAAAEAKDKKDA